MKETVLALSLPLVMNPTPSATLKSKTIQLEYEQSGKTVYNWGLGANPLPVPNIVHKALSKHADQKAYGLPGGLPELATLIAKRDTIKGYFEVSPKRVLVAPGLKQLIQDVQLAFTGPIIHVVPHWVSYREQAQILGRKTYQIETLSENQYKLTPEDIQTLMKTYPSIAQQTKLVIFNNPTNPTGLVYSSHELQALAKAFKQYKCIIFSDEVYLGNVYDDKKQSIAQWLPKQTIRASSLSKEFGLGGYRLGWASFPEELKKLYEMMYAIGTSSYTCASLPIQHAAIAALSQHSEMIDFAKHSRKIFRTAAHFLYERLSEHHFMTSKPNAAWYFFIDFEHYRKQLQALDILSAEALGHHLLEKLGMVFVSGEPFGMPKHKFLLRASFVDFEPNAAMKWARESLDKMPTTPPAWLNKMIKSIELLAKYMKSLPSRST